MGGIIAENGEKGEIGSLSVKIGVILLDEPDGRPRDRSFGAVLPPESV